MVWWNKRNTKQLEYATAFTCSLVKVITGIVFFAFVIAVFVKIVLFFVNLL
jgi:hypothetical protein